MKQETIEEFINKSNTPEGLDQFSYDKGLEDGVRRGINWQQEQILQFLYSEITERRPYSSSKMCEVVIEFIEQFKKK